MLPGEGAYEAAKICVCVERTCTCTLPDPQEEMADYWIVGKGHVAAWGRELYEAEQCWKAKGNGK